MIIIVIIITIFARLCVWWARVCISGRGHACDYIGMRVYVGVVVNVLK